MNLSEIVAHLEGFKLLMEERDRRHEERSEAQREAVQAALAASDRAVAKAEMAAEKRFEGVNEFRSALADQQRTFIPRAEVMVITSALNAKIDALTKQTEQMLAERVGVKGGWGYAVGAVGIVLTVVSLLLMVYRFK